MKNKLTAVLICVTALLMATSTFAQRWNPTPTNPISGLNADPSFCYNPDTGFIYISNAGANGIDDSDAAGAFRGDDYPLVSVLISFPGTLNTGVSNNADSLDDPITVLPVFDAESGIAWGAPVLFNGSFQLVGNPVAAPGALAISQTPVALMQIDTGLTAADFGSVTIESGFSFEFGAGGGGTTFSVGNALDTGAFHIGDCLTVPEPGALSLLSMAGLGFGLILRRRRK